MDLRELRYLVAVLDEGSISRAAERLHMTQPPLSMAMAKLEKSLGTALFDRHPKGVSPTAAGAYLMDHARRLLAEFDALPDMVRAVGDGSRGVLAIAVTPANAWEHAPSLLSTFARAVPDAEVDLRQEPPNEVIDDVRSRRVDVGLVYCADVKDLRRTLGADLHVALLAMDPLVVALPPGRTTVSDPLPLTELVEDRWAVPWTQEGYPGLADLVHDAWRRADITARTLNVGTLQEALPLVQAGLAVAVMPESITAIGGSRVLTVSTQPTLGCMHSALLWRRSENPSPVLRRLLHIAHESSSDPELIHAAD